MQAYNEAESPMNGAAISPARALVRANLRRLSASLPRSVARRRLLSAAAALTRVANSRLRHRAFSPSLGACCSGCSVMREYSLYLYPRRPAVFAIPRHRIRKQNGMDARNNARTIIENKQRILLPRGLLNAKSLHAFPSGGATRAR